MKAAIIQSNYIPWKGYFDIINTDALYAPRKGFTRESSKLANSVRLGGGVPT